MSFSRILTFRCKDLGKQSTFVLTFDDEKIPGIYKDCFPTAFKVTAFGAKGPYEFRVVYKSDLGFTRAQISGGIVEPASTYTPINVGEQTTLTEQGSPAVYSFSTPQDVTPPTKQMIAVNNTATKQDIGVGFFQRPDRAPSQVLVFTGVGSQSRVQAQFTPVLGGYMTSDYQENEILKGQISTPRLFGQDLVQLAPDTNWLVTYNMSSGVYKIEPDPSF